MKKLSLLTLAAAGLLLTACSSDKDEVTGGNSQVAVTTGSEGYVGISISLPSASSTTRANDELNNGKQDEFNVKNAYLYLFKGNEEATATFVKRYSLTNNFIKDDQVAGDGTATSQTGVSPTGSSGTAITSTSVSVCKIEKLTLLPSENLYAYVAVNAQGTLASEPAANITFADFSKQIYNAADHGGTLEGAIGTSGLLMTSSPISDVKGGEAAPAATAKLTTLVKLDKDAIKNTEVEAKNSPAGCVFVERAAAKVTVVGGGTLGSSITMAGETLPFVLDGWMVINTEPKFYNTRQLAAAWNPLFSQYYTGYNNTYRFVSLYKFDPTLPSGGTHTTGYRTYFAQDPQYDIEAETRAAGNQLLYTVAGETGRNWLAVGTDSRAFVTENTFDVDRQERQNTTQVTLRVKFNGGDDFYTISDDAKYYASIATVQSAISAKITALYDVTSWLNQACTYLNGLETDDSKKVYQGVVGVTVPATSTAGIQELTLTPTFTNTAGGTKGYDDLSTDLKTAWETATTGVAAQAKLNYTVSCYKGGYSYYNIRIKHFGEIETPWAASRATQPGATIEQIYGDASTRTADYLGRYGVVRDNWYNLSIDGIAKLGSAVPTPVPGDKTPDDEIEKEYYISAHVHILPWVLRTQSVNF